MQLQAHHVMRVMVELCTAPRPSVHLRGSSEKYTQAFNELREELTNRLGKAGALSVVANRGGRQDPRVGAFEVSFTLIDIRNNGQSHGPLLVFSKLGERCWPSPSKLGAQIQAAVFQFERESQGVSGG